MKYTAKVKIIIAFLVVGLGVSRCSEDFLELYPENSLSAGTFYRNAEDFEKAVNGIYDAYQSYDGEIKYFPFMDCMTPYANQGGSRFGYWDNGEITVTSGWKIADRYWKTFYATIFRANEVLEHIDDQSVSIPVDTRNRLKGEALFMRSLCYFYITNFWGDAPLVLNVQSYDEILVERDPREKIISQIINDLGEAKRLLPSVTKYRGVESLLGRASKGAAQSLLGKLYAFEGNWADAKTELGAVISSGDYKLIDNFSDMFWPTGENGMESIFEIQYSDDTREGTTYVRYAAPNSKSGIHYKGYNYINPNESYADLFETKNGYSVKSSFNKREDNAPAYRYVFNYACDDPEFDASKPFDNRDPRLAWTIWYENTPYISEFEARTGQTGITYIPGYSTSTNHNTVKYVVGKLDKTGSHSPGNYIVLRYADVLLLYAEALIAEGQYDEAAGYINQVRQRPSVNMSAIPLGLNESQITEALRKERFRELAFEYGHLYLDMKRWDTLADETVAYWTANKNGSTNPALSSYNKNYYWWPVPEAERTKNPNLTQNPGY